jgi:hypothetical protein
VNSLTLQAIVLQDQTIHNGTVPSLYASHASDLATSDQRKDDNGGIHSISMIQSGYLPATQAYYCTLTELVAFLHGETYFLYGSFTTDDTYTSTFYSDT